MSARSAALVESLDVQTACIEREIRMRERMYPRWVAAGRMSQALADRELAVMRAVLVTLRALAAPVAPAQGGLFG